MIYATDFDELVYTCTELLLHNPAKLVSELVSTIGSDSHYAAATSFAIIHASFDLCLPQEHISTFFSAVSSECSEEDVLECTKILAGLEETYYSGYMLEYKGRLVFRPTETLQ